MASVQQAIAKASFDALTRVRSIDKTLLRAAAAGHDSIEAGRGDRSVENGEDSR